MNCQKDIIDFPGYTASSDGRLFRNGREIKGSVSSTGYKRTVVIVDGKRKDVFIHRMIAFAFFGECNEGYTVNHIDGNKQNNDISNLEYVSRGDNTRLAWANGLCPTGEKHGRYTSPDRTARGEKVSTSKLNTDDVLAIRNLRNAGIKLKEIAYKYGISTSQAWNIVSNSQWRHV